MTNLGLTKFKYFLRHILYKFKELESSPMQAL